MWLTLRQHSLSPRRLLCIRPPACRQRWMLQRRSAVVEEKAEMTAALVVSEYQSSTEIQQVKDVNFDEGVRSFLYNVVNE